MISEENLRGLSTFALVAEAGGFTKAAERLGMSKSAIAKTVGRLEQRLGVRLFNRTTRRFSLTSEGQSFYETCSKLLAELEGAQDALISHDQRPKGLLRVDLPVVFGRRWLLPVLLDVMSRNDELKMEITFTDRHVDPGEDGIDLVVRIGDIPDSATLTVRQLGLQQSVLCASPAYIAARGAPDTVADLDGHSCIVFSSGRQPQPWWFIDGEGRLFAHPVAGSLVTNDSDAICDAAIAGQGIAVLATWLIADHLKQGRLIEVLPTVRTRGFPIKAVWPRSRVTAPKIRFVIDELAARFSPLPPWNQQN